MMHIPTLALQAGPDSWPVFLAEYFGLLEKFGVKLKLKAVLGNASLKKCLDERSADLVLIDPYVTTKYFGSQADQMSLWRFPGARSRIVLSEKLVREGASDERGFMELVKQRDDGKTLRIAVPSLPCSSSVLFEQGLKSLNVGPKRTEMVAMPYHLMSGCMRRQDVDACCVTQPWVADLVQGTGRVVIDGLYTGAIYTESALYTHQEYVERYGDVYQGIISAVREVGRVCTSEKDFERVAQELRERWPDYLHLPGRVELQDFVCENLVKFKLLGNCFWREGFEAAFGPDRMGEKEGQKVKNAGTS